MAVGVFGLQDAYKLKRTELLSLEDTHGWFGGGFSGPLSTVDRIDFSNDTGTANIRSPLSLARPSLTATGNSNYGWFGGGGFPAGLTTVERIDFSNDSATASPRGPLSLARRDLAATGNSNYGWFGGGFAPSIPGRVTTVERIDFSNDSATASPRGPLSLARNNLAATGNSNYGWFGGGVNPSTNPVTTVDRIDFSNDSATASVRGSLSLSRYDLAATGNSNYGWFGGGGFPSRSTVDRSDFSNDSNTLLIRGPLSFGKFSLAATGNSNYGWFGGYATGAGVERIDFSNDSSNLSIRGPLSSARYEMGATSGQAKSSSIRLQKAGNFGWFGGGQNPAASPTTLLTVDRIDFSNDAATSSLRGSLSLARNNLAATGNSNYGWFGGGLNPAASPTTVSRVDRIDFSNDSATASPRGSLSFARSSLAATGNSNYGWFGGGQPGPVSRVDRIDFSNDSATASVRGNLSLSRNALAATGNSNYGWFGGGYFSTSRVDRIDFSNDAATSSVRGPLISARYRLAATGNSNYGWFGGGFSQDSFSPVNTIDRINFSNDSVTASPRSFLSTPTRGLSATGNTNYGWFSGGFPNSSLTLVNRINFSNDTTSARGQLSAARAYLSATSNTPIG